VRRSLLRDPPLFSSASSDPDLLPNFQGFSRPCGDLPPCLQVRRFLPHAIRHGNPIRVGFGFSLALQIRGHAQPATRAQCFTVKFCSMDPCAGPPPSILIFCFSFLQVRAKMQCAFPPAYGFWDHAGPLSVPLLVSL